MVAFLPTSCHVTITQDEAYEYFLNNGEFPAPRQTLPPYEWLPWKLRLMAVTWVLLLTVGPLLVMYLTLTWQTMSAMLTGFFSRKDSSTKPFQTNLLRLPSI